jgi:hypothetical protein
MLNCSVMWSAVDSKLSMNSNSMTSSNLVKLKKAKRGANHTTNALTTARNLSDRLNKSNQKSPF